MPARAQPPIASSPKKMLISSRAPSTIAASTTWPLPEVRTFDQRGEDADHDELAAAAEVASEVDRRNRRAALGADVPRARRRSRGS